MTLDNEKVSHISLRKLQSSKTKAYFSKSVLLKLYTIHSLSNYTLIVVQTCVFFANKEQLKPIIKRAEIKKIYAQYTNKNTDQQEVFISL